MAEKRISILGITLDNLPSIELKRRLLHILTYRRQAQIVTPNPEFLLAAQDDKEFYSVLNSAALAIPDGMGLKFAAWLKGVNLRRHPGANLVTGLLNLASAKKYRVAVLNWQDGLSSDDDIRAAVARLYPGVELFVASLDRVVKGYDISALRSFRPDLLFVTFGAPWQDIFISRYRRSLPSLRLAMGVGGSFDFLTRRLKRAPGVFRWLGLEWLWRLILQPWRWKRMWRAVAVFSFEALRWELRQFRYRPNVAALIVNDRGETLILNAKGRGDYWGLPQGGIDPGESAEEAVLREVQEETSLRELRIVRRFSNIYKYTWSKPYTRYGYKGQSQSLFILRYGGPRDAVRLSRYEHKAFRWVKIEDLLHKASPVHKKQYEIFLEKYYSVSNKINN